MDILLNISQTEIILSMLLLPLSLLIFVIVICDLKIIFFNRNIYKIDYYQILYTSFLILLYFFLDFSLKPIKSLFYLAFNKNKLTFNDLKIHLKTGFLEFGYEKNPQKITNYGFHYVWINTLNKSYKKDENSKQINEIKKNIENIFLKKYQENKSVYNDLLLQNEYNKLKELQK